MHIPIIYQDTDLIVVDKPTGMPTHAADPADPYPSDALRIVQRQAGLAYVGMHQRLDADTSGVLLFAARREANKALAAAFEGRDVRKVYLALVHGSLLRAEGVIDAPIVREHGERYRITMPSDPRGLAARTRYRVIGQSETVWGASGARRKALPFLVLEIIPESGRPHQIRVHLAHIGCPVVGDPLYGPADRPAPRLFLHAWRLTLPHPATGQVVTFTAPPPIGFDLAPSSPRPVREEGLMSRPPRAGWGGGEVAARAGEVTQLQFALARRAPLAADPATTIYRLVNAVADGWPDVTVDRYGDTLVASIYDDFDLASAPPVVRGDLVDRLTGVTDFRSCYVKYRPKEAGRVLQGQLAHLAPPRPIVGPARDEFVAYEDGLAYIIRPGAGLSVGLFPDMREGRARVRAWSAGRRVLNCFAYTCGFGVAATAGGARRVLNLDLSKIVLAWGQENYRVNGFKPDPQDFVFGDVFDWLARLAKRGDRFDLVILDPPGFSRTKGRTFSAVRDYGDLAALAAQVTAPDGLILACCNVAEWPRRMFRDRVLAGVAQAGRAAEVAGVFHEPAIDFPVQPGMEPYLKMLLAHVA